MGYTADDSGKPDSCFHETLEQLVTLTFNMPDSTSSNALTQSLAQNERDLSLHSTHDHSEHDLQNMIATTPSVKLPYTIHSCSSYTGVYRPENILVDEPTEQSSRWASAANDLGQYIILRLEMPAVACAIRFGKYHTYHVCNLKEFKVYGGMDTENMVELLHHGLQNNKEAELFTLKYYFDGVILPVQYIKIIPLAAYHASFNYSIWFVELLGIKQEQLVTKVLRAYYNYKEMEIIRLCLKHFRQRNMMEIFSAIQEQTGVKLEHPLLSQLHRCLVLEGDFRTAEKIIDHASSRNLFQSHVISGLRCYHQQQACSLILEKEADGLPCARGGHQMCIDVEAKQIYLLGGWDGQRDLADFWRYHIEDNQWELLSRDTEKQGGPGARSCHKLCFDPQTRSIYVLGRFLESWAVAALKPEADFYRYRIDEIRWEKISGNTAREGGPELIYDHQMCIDTQTNTIYVFGGRVITDNPTHHIYSGLYSYDISSNVWKLVRSDIDERSSGCQYIGVKLPSRVGHAMLFDPVTRDLLIFGGQRFKDYLCDLYRYSVDLDTVNELWQGYSKNTGPDPGYTQRATIDVDLREMYVFSGYMGSRASSEPRNALWLYDIPKGRWCKVYQNDTTTGNSNNSELLSNPSSSNDEDTAEPCPRFAHQVVYDPKSKLQYIFGGNPGDSSNNARRLDDFWELRLVKETTESIVRRCLYLIRAQHLREMCLEAQKKQMDDNGFLTMGSMEALEYLRTQVAPLVDHGSKEESAEFTRLSSTVCMAPEEYVSLLKSMKYPPSMNDAGDIFQARTKLFEQLIRYFPRDMQEPRELLIDAVKIGQNC